MSIKHIKEKLNESISTKLFIITISIFILFLTFTLLIQRVFFESMYSKKKQEEIKLNTIKFAEEYDKINGYDKVLELMKEYEEFSDIYMAVVEYNKDFSVAMNIEVVGENIKRSKYVNDILVEVNKNPTLVEKLLHNKLVVFNVENVYNKNKDLVCIALDKDKLIIGTTSMQPINEGISVIEELYKYFYIIAIIIILILSLIYSTMITKPLKRINSIAKKMSNLDFDEKCEVTSEDELGNLATTLNFLSENLSKALTSLKRTNLQLQKEIEKERKMETVRKDFVAAVSHELKTPITIIKGYAEGIKDGIFSGQDKIESLEIIIEETNKMGKLVKDMLDLSALESNVTMLNYDVFDLKEVIEKNIKSLSNEINDKEIKINRSYINESYIKADKFRMDQVVTNFITNAIRHTEPLGSIWISMNIEDTRLRVSFENTADPLSEEELKNIWSKFYKIDKSRSRSIGGSGLGLSIVKNILEIHNMEYGVRNTNRGIEFYFYCYIEGAVEER